MNTSDGLHYVHIRTLLAEMRKYRLGLVQAPEQLRFAYQSIIEALDTDWEADNEVNIYYINILNNFNMLLIIINEIIIYTFIHKRCKLNCIVKSLEKSIYI